MSVSFTRAVLVMAVLLSAAVSVVTANANVSSATVLFDGRTVTVDPVLQDANDLWVLPADLPSVNDFELKPQGACFEDICVPVKQDQDSAIFIRRAGQAWFNVSELATRLQQPVVVDHETNTWSLGAIPVSRARFVERGVAPNFTLPDWQGNSVSLSDFKGKKVMILSWASW